ncbi:sulfotransferase [Candidatus Albibeggiatoa sp. nov. NOAA]|uniref:sulfotransferase family protein n=1 Tax=Candidatus Albibeggiatoa sp. nov. NOAA TaxID=3162724 RepID=UPI0032FB6449|nr:sulfotransferase [Thiotrichaceae bacterium]
MQIIVLGMHRSGTSVVAGLLNLMGAYFAPDDVALPADMTNPKGYWERKDVIIANKILMESMGATWHQVSQWDINQITAAQKSQFQQQIEPIINNLNQHQHWLLKDPRLCLTLPLWQPYFNNPVYVVVYRSPIQIAQSLHKRNQFTLHTGLALWERHMLDGLNAIQNKPTVLVSFHDLVSNPIETVKQLYHNIEKINAGLKLPSDDDIVDFVQPTYMHQRGNNQLLKAFANQPQLNLVQQFEQNTIFNTMLPELSKGAQVALQQHDLQFQQQQQIQQLVEQKTQFEYWLDSLSGDIQATFNSQTWRIGEQLTSIILKLTGKKRGETAKDNAQRMIDEYQDWKSKQ